MSVFPYSSKVDGNTVILVVHGSTVDNRVAARANINIKSIGVVATGTVTGLVVDGYVVDSQFITATAANGCTGVFSMWRLLIVGGPVRLLAAKNLGLILPPLLLLPSNQRTPSVLSLVPLGPVIATYFVEN